MRFAKQNIRSKQSFANLVYFIHFACGEIQSSAPVCELGHLLSKGGLPSAEGTKRNAPPDGGKLTGKRTKKPPCERGLAPPQAVTGGFRLWEMLQLTESPATGLRPAALPPLTRGPLCSKRSLFNLTNKSKINVYYLIPDTVFFVTVPDFDTVNQAVYKVLVQLGYIGVLLRKLYKLRCVVRLSL